MTQVQEITPDVISKLGLTPGEYDRIKGVLKREPNINELGVFSVMYSEHCSYKNSRNVLKLFPKHGKRVLIGAGEENAGVIDIGDGWCVSFKIESHNHPSAIEPFQGAATGVGGILRDIFTMGARPVLVMNSLRFGTLDKPQNRHLMKGVVAGISHYGNCIGVPTIGGEVYFDECYEGNPLVNALALGIMRTKDIARGKATGVGNPVFYLGAATGRDGIGGASFASKEISEDSYKDRPAVQVGDPFMEKLLLEAVLELLQTDAVVGIQDMGAAGLTCSTCETASRGNSGIEIDVALVPQRETGMTPYETLLSESQERMLVIVKKGKEQVAIDIFEKWDLHAAEIGFVTDTGQMVVKENGKVVVDAPAKQLAEDAPLYIREEQRPAYLDKLKPIRVADLPPTGDLNAALLKILDSPTVASKEWIYHQYDHMVGTATIVLPGSDASVIRVKGTDKRIAMSVDCNATYCYLDPYEGGKIAVAEAARNIVCSGALPLSVTDNLNYGNPMKPEVFWTFRKSIEGIRDACLKFDTPVSGGNVSFYNENPKGAIDPTPTIGIMGLIEGRDPIPSAFQKAGDAIILFGATREELGGTEFLKVMHKLKDGIPPRLDLDEADAFNRTLLECAEQQILRSAHDLSEGGFAAALAECAMSDDRLRLGAEVTVKADGLSNEAFLFGETQSRAILSCDPKHLAAVEAVITKHGLAHQVIGKVGGDRVKINNLINVPVTVLRETWNSSIRRRMSA
ncbi:MAG: phosphoribosylformylglycinamidine synthase subunit PurL [Candidatus Omnitrophica bacterium]|nr:phosphoribosylformylglycinamidine synthase subunit PurL [Candidatus Omnitrophota bacterium]